MNVNIIQSDARVRMIMCDTIVYLLSFCFCQSRERRLSSSFSGVYSIDMIYICICRTHASQHICFSVCSPLNLFFSQQSEQLLLLLLELMCVMARTRRCGRTSPSGWKPLLSLMVMVVGWR